LLDATLSALRDAGFDALVWPATARRARRKDQRRRIALVSSTSDPAAGPTGLQESCSPLFGELTRHEIWLFALDAEPTGADDLAAAIADGVLAPFTPAELAELVRLNPLTWRGADSYLSSGVSLSGITLLYRDHLLLEKLNLLLALLKLGLRADRTVVIGKPDLTFYRHRVIAHLCRRGLTVLDSADHLGPRFLTARGRGSATVVVDDGADLALSVLADGRSAGNLAVIETTAKGIRILRRAGLLDKVVNLSDTTIKSELAGSIAASCVYRFRELLRHDRLNGAECVVVGYGMLGQHVAPMLRQLGLAVRVCEIAPDALARARQAGFPAYPDLASAGSPTTRYLFGCSGERSITLGDILRLSADVVLCALSSQDLLPVIEELRAAAAIAPVRGVGTRYRFDGRTVTVLADGHAINLHYNEGVSEPDFDPFTALTGAAIVESALALMTPSRSRPQPEILCAAVRSWADSENSTCHRPAPQIGVT
jgi:hypothetical protein